MSAAVRNASRRASRRPEFLDRQAARRHRVGRLGLLGVDVTLVGPYGVMSSNTQSRYRLNP